MGESLEAIVAGRSRREMEEQQNPGTSGGVEVSLGHVIGTALLASSVAVLAMHNTIKPCSCSAVGVDDGPTISVHVPA